MTGFVFQGLKRVKAYFFDGGGAPLAAAGSSCVCRLAVVSCSFPGCVFAGAGVFVCVSPAADAGTPVSTLTLRED